MTYKEFRDNTLVDLTLQWEEEGFVPSYLEQMVKDVGVLLDTAYTFGKKGEDSGETD